MAGTGGVRRRLPPLVAALAGCYVGLLVADRSRVVVQGDSMLPTLLEGDVLVCIPVLPGVRTLLLRPGRIVVVRHPVRAKVLVVKRLTAVVGDRVEVQGDNRGASTDSRQWGWLPRAAVRQVAVRRWPQIRTPLRRRVG